jgi:hypothetical protein
MAPQKRQSAFIKATQEAQAAAAASTSAPATTVTPLHRDNVEKQDSTTVPQREASTGLKKDKKVSFYLTRDQEDKLDNLEIEFRQRYKQKINRNEIVRHLIDQCDIDSLSNLTS